MSQPVLLCGLGQVGWRVFEFFRAAGITVVAIDSHCDPADPRLQGARLVQGDFRRPEVLAQAGLADARGVVIATSDDLANVSTALMVRHLNPNVRVVVRVFNQNLLPRLGKTVRNVVPLSTSSLTAPLLALTALTAEALGAFPLGEGRCQVAELRVNADSPVRGQTIATVAERYQARIVAHLRPGDREQFLLDVDQTRSLEAGDHVVVCGAPKALAPLFQESGNEALPHLLWAGWARRLGRVVWRTLAEVDTSVKVCTATLVVVVFLSTLVYHFGVDKTFATGLFRTISVISTGGELHEDELSLGWQKVFVSLLRVFGAALTAAFTAIVTNYLLRARLGGALEMRRIPDGGHIVVCGLGNVGFRVVEELLQYDEPVVVIEYSRDSRFAATTRRLGVPVIFGDATVLEVLRQAHAATAHAVVVATSNELANLEIALLARELNPKQRIVVRLADPYLAETLREGANVRLALSIPDLAAPAFVAAFFGDRVQSVFVVRGQMLAVVELLVQAEDPVLADQVVHALAVDYRLLPLSKNGVPWERREQALKHRLVSGDRLVVIAALNDLERLLRRERVLPDHVVEVTGHKLTAKSIVLELGRKHGVPARENGETAVPFVVGEPLTRGHAEVLAEDLRREGLQVTVRPVNP
jgi:Trk K+ transport system NAD-binding subunit